MEREYIIKFDGLMDHLEGRITIIQIGEKYNAEINLVMIESGKIYKHIKNIYDHSSEEELVRISTQTLQRSFSV